MQKVGLLAYGENSYTALKTLIKEFKVLWIITPPGKRKPLSVENLAKKEGIKILKTNSERDLEEIIKKKLPDAVVIASYNKILTNKVLSLTKFINIHHGDLPRYKGRANINWAIINGRKEIGLSFHQAIADLDSGNIYKQIIVKINKKDTVKTIYDKFNNLIELYLNNITKKVIGGYKGKRQDGKSTYCCTRLPQDGLIDWNKKSVEINRLIRAVTKPYPGAFTYYRNRKLIIWDSEVPTKGKKYEGRIPGRVINIYKGRGVEILTGDKTILIKNVNYEGKDLRADEIINTVKISLGINLVEVYERMMGIA